MNGFQPIAWEDRERLRAYYAACPYALCEYAWGTKWMWRDYLHPEWAELAGCLVVANTIKGRLCFDYPVPGPHGDEAAALGAIETLCRDRELPLEISVVPEEKAPALLFRYPHAKVSNVRSWQDYLYRREELAEFTGRRLRNPRNHLNKFYKLWPEAELRPLGREDGAAIEGFWADYQGELESAGKSWDPRELERSKELLALAGEPCFCAGGLFLGETLLGLSLGEVSGETLIIHVEKALYSYSGVYQALVREFVRAFGGSCQWVNREDDAGDPGIRSSKLQYCPEKLLPKFRFRVENEFLLHLKEIPTLETERLRLRALQEADIPAYNALVLDRERNRYWGFDDLGALEEPLGERSFFEVARRDFQKGMAVNFAICLGERFIGEAVLYHYDFRGGMELGCRISREYAGMGYGREAFAALAHWGLYGLQLHRVYARCFRENEPSYKMLSSCMKACGEDESTCYFEKLV